MRYKLLQTQVACKIEDFKPILDENDWNDDGNYYPDDSYLFKMFPKSDWHYYNRTTDHEDNQLCIFEFTRKRKKK